MKTNLTTVQQEETARQAELVADGARIKPGAVNSSFAEFHDLYTQVVRHLSNKNPYTVLIYLPEEVVIQFPQQSEQQFIISRTEGRYLVADDFNFIMHRKEYGDSGKPVSFLSFLWSELQSYWVWLSLTFFISLVSLHFAGSPETYSLLSGLLIQSATVFVSVFLIFTVTQSSILQSDVSLFRGGTLHRYRRADRNVAILGIITIVLIILNSMFVSLDKDTLAKSLDVFVFGFKLTLFNFWGAITTSIIITLLIDAFISVVGYYLERSQDVVDRDLMLKVLAMESERTQKKPPAKDN